MNINQARAKLDAELTPVLHGLLSSSEKPAPVVLVTAPAGIGKSHLVAQRIRGQNVAWFGERNSMIHEVQRFVDTALDGEPPCPSKAVVEKRPAREDQGFCKHYKSIIGPLRARGLGRFDQSKGCLRCPDKTTCRYLNWKPNTTFTFAPTTWLGLDTDNPKHCDGKDVAVIDESPLNHLIRSVTFTRRELIDLRANIRQAQLGAVGRIARLALIDMLDTAIDLIDHPPPGRRRLALRSLLADLGYCFKPFTPVRTRDFLFGAVTGPNASSFHAPATTEVTVGQIAAVLTISGLSEGMVKKVLELTDSLVADTADRPTCLVALPEGQTEGGILAGRVIKPRIPDTLPVVVLDATADVLVYERLFPGRPMILVGGVVDLHANILQTTDHRYPCRTLQDNYSPAIDRLMTIVDEYRTQHPGDRCAVVLKKGMFEESLRVSNRVLASIDRKDIRFFWSLRGSNALKDYNAIFIVGAPELPPLEMEARARAFMSSFPIPEGVAPMDYRIVPVINEAFGQGLVEVVPGVHLQERGYPQIGPMAVYYQFHQAEFVQAALRIRPYDPAKKKTIFVLTNIFLPELPTTLVKEKRLLPIKVPTLIKRAEVELYKLRSAGRKGPIPEGELARILGVTKGRFSQAKKKTLQHSSWRTIQRLLNEWPGKV
jgi:hypothetical protein